MKQVKLADRRLSSRHLTLLFLAIIMTMSILFSSVFYITSVQVLDKRIGHDIQTTQIQDPNHELNEWIGRRTDESKITLGQHLIILNIIALAVGALASYLLARTALKPIERALDEQDRFISDASHELRTPITAALLSNEVALKNKSLTLAQARSVLQENISDMQELKRLSDELLDQTRADYLHEKLQVISFRKLISEGTAKNEKLALEKKIAIIQQVSDVTVHTYPKTIATILTILINNSIKYSPEGTTITVIGVTTSRQLTITVKDEGIGISKADQTHIFDRFYRSDLSRSEQEGYGLGLSIAKGLVLHMEGSIRVASTQGSGSTFTVTLPQQPE